MKKKFAMMTMLAAMAIGTTMQASNVQEANLMSVNAPGKTQKEKVVTATEVRNYFHRNDAPVPQQVLFTSQAAFDRQFSPAARMGVGGEPTKLNFRRQAVVAIVLPETNRTAEISDVKLVETAKNRLRLSYTVNYGQRQSYTTQPIELLTIDSKYRNARVEVVPTVVKMPVETTSDFRCKTYTDEDRNIRLSLDFPTQKSNLDAGVQDFEAIALTNLVGAFSDDSASKLPRYNTSEGSFEQMLDFYAKQLTDSMAEVDRENGRPEQRSTAWLKVMRTDETPAYLTLETTGYVYTGGAHGMGITGGATFDKLTGAQAELVQPSTELRQLLTTKLPAEVKAMYSADQPVAMPSTPAYLKDGSLVFHYQSDEIAAHAAGDIAVTLYPDEAAPFLTEQGKRLMK